MSIKIAKEYISTDINLAASLVAVGYDLVDLDRTDSRRVRFVFRVEDGLEETVSAFWDGTLEVSAKQVLNTLRELKNRIYAGV